MPDDGQQYDWNEDQYQSTGNGWVVRKMSQKPSCVKAIGIDKSKMMIKNAKSKISSEKESYFVTDLESWDTKEKFDVIFSMESLYYSVPMEPVLGISVGGPD